MAQKQKQDSHGETRSSSLKPSNEVKEVVLIHGGKCSIIYQNYIPILIVYRYVKHVGRPLLWPACQERLKQNPNFMLMEDNASPHVSAYTNTEREKEDIPKTPWPPNSPDFNPIECI